MFLLKGTPPLNKTNKDHEYWQLRKNRRKEKYNQNIWHPKKVEYITLADLVARGMGGT